MVVSYVLKLTQNGSAFVLTLCVHIVSQGNTSCYLGTHSLGPRTLDYEGDV